MVGEMNSPILLTRKYMIHNPDPKKYIIKKLRGKGHILVDRSLLKWRKVKPQLSFEGKRKLGRPRSKPDRFKKLRGMFD